MHVVLRQTGPEHAVTDTRAVAIIQGEDAAVEFASAAMVQLVGGAQVLAGVQGGIAIVPDERIEQTIRFLVQEVSP